MKYYNVAGELVDAKIEPQIHSQAAAANLSVSQFINRQYPTDVGRYGTTFDQMLASSGMIVPSNAQQRNMGYRAPTMADVLSGNAQFQAAGGSTSSGTPYGSESRTLFPVAVIEAVETYLTKDFNTDKNQFDKLVARTISIAGQRFEQPQINYDTPNGPTSTRSQRRSQLANPPSMMRITTSDKVRSIPTFALGMEISNEAMKVTTLDLLGLSIKRQLAVEQDKMIYEYLSDMYAGDNDINTSSLSTLGYSVATNTLDSGAASGTITQKAWLKWLWRNRKYRIIDTVICDLDTYLKIEARTGRPSLTAIDTTLPRLEAHARIVNNVIGDVNVFIVDDAASGGPIPANTIVGLDSRYAIARVRNSLADVQAAEKYAMRQSEAFMTQWGEICYRQYPDAFDVLTVA